MNKDQPQIQPQIQAQPGQVILIKSPNGGYIVANQPEGSIANNEVNESNRLEQAAHPNICLLHMFFKVISAGLYFLSWIISTNLTMGLAMIILAAFDFWVVKNVSGRFFILSNFFYIV